MDYMFRQQLENDKPIRFNNGIEVRNKRNWLTNWREKVKSYFFSDYWCVTRHHEQVHEKKKEKKLRVQQQPKKEKTYIIE